MPTLEELADFWRQTREELSIVPMNAKAEPVASKTSYLVERVSFQSWGDEPIEASLGRPITAAREKKLPAIVTPPGYGGWEFGTDLSESLRGCLILQVYPRHQGRSKSVDDGVDHLSRGLPDRDSFNYRGIFMDIVRGIDYLATRPEVDVDRIALMGTSQGGGIVLATAAINPRVRAVVAHVPYFCDVANNSAFAKHPLREAANAAMFQWFDPVALAPLIKAPTLISSGGADKVCPPETIRAVYDRLPGVKALYHDPEMTHTTSTDFHLMSWQWMQRYLF